MGTGHRKSSAALLIVCERIFLLLGADHSSADQVRTKDDELLKRVYTTRLEKCVRSPCHHNSRMRTFDENSCAISITSPRSLFRPRTQQVWWDHREKSRRASTLWDCRGKSQQTGPDVNAGMKHLSKHGILSDHQHAFRKARSFETQLIVTNHDLTKNLDDKLTTDIAILDFAKAFDVMPHQRLLIKLDFYGIRSHAKNWISSFLTKRFQRVVLNGKSSDWSPVLSGAPQGTVLVPHLFLLHINNIHDGISSTIRLFADDCLVYNTIKSQKDEDSLQQDLHKLVSWALPNVPLCGFSGEKQVPPYI